MSVFGRYLKYRLKDSALRSIVMTVVSVLITQSIIKDTTKIHFGVESASSGIASLTFVICALATVLPFLETKRFKNRRNLDTLYFFPIKRSSLAWAHYLSGIIQMTFVYAVTTIAAYIYLASNTWYFRLGYIWPFFFFTLLCGVVIYSVFIFMFGQANTEGDGVVFSLFWIGTLSSTMIFAEAFIHAAFHTAVALPTDWGVLYTPIIKLTQVFSYLININERSTPYTTEQIRGVFNHSYWFAIWAVLGALAVFGYIRTFTKKGAQKIGEVSDSWFGYKVLIPLYGYSYLFISGCSLEFIPISLFVGIYIGYVIYRRSFKISLADIIMIAIGIIPMLLGQALLWE